MTTDLAPARGRLLKAVDVSTALEHGTGLRRRHDAEQRDVREQLDAAYAAGRAAGRAEGLGELGASSSRAATALERLAGQLPDCAEEVSREVSAALLDTSVALAEWVLRHQLSAETAGLVARLEDAATGLLPAARGVVCVHAADADAVTAWAAARPLGAGTELSVVVAPELHPGEAELRLGPGSAHLTVADALLRAAAALGQP